MPPVGADGVELIDLAHRAAIDTRRGAVFQAVHVQMQQVGVVVKLDVIQTRLWLIGERDEEVFVGAQRTADEERLSAWRGAQMAQDGRELAIGRGRLDRPPPANRRCWPGRFR